MALTLYGYKNNPRTRIVQIVAAAQGIDLELIEVVPRNNVNLDLLKNRFPRSCGKIPALEGPRVKLTEVLAIAHYVAKMEGPATLLGDGSPEQEAEVISWVSWANQELLVTLAKWFLPLIPNWSRPAPYDKAAVEGGRSSSLVMLDVLEAMVGNKTHLVGQGLSLADIFVAMVLSRGLEWTLDTSWRAQHPCCMRHFEMVASWEPVSRVIPDFPMVESEPDIRDAYA